MKKELIYQAILSTLAHEATAEEQRAVDEWLRESEENREEYERLSRLYKKSTAVRKPKQFDVDRAWKEVSDRTIYNRPLHKKKNWVLSPWLRYAAVVAIVAACGIFYFTDLFHTEVMREIDMTAFNEPTLLLEGGDEIDLSEQSFTMKRDQALIKNDADNLLSYESVNETEKEVTRNRLIIPRGKTYKLVMEDGTKVWLNSETELSYPSSFSGEKREVTLVGEAYFEVTPNKQKPFLVKTNGMAVRVLGTSFNVCYYKDSENTSTTLVEGSVAVRTADGVEKTMIPSQRLDYNKKSNRVSVEKVDTELYTSWINGVYIFKNAPLEEILEKLQRWYDFSIVYQDETLKHTRFSLTADRKTDIDKLLEVINYTSDVKLEKQGKSINVIKQRRIQ